MNISRVSRVSRVSLVVLCLSLSAHLVAQQPSRGEQALASKDWFTAEHFFRDSVRGDPKNGESWFHLGEALYGQQKFAEAADAFRQANDANYQPMRSQYREAKSL